MGKGANVDLWGVGGGLDRALAETSCVTTEMSLDFSELWSPRQNGSHKRPSVGFKVKSDHDTPLLNPLQSLPITRGVNPGSSPRDGGLAAPPACRPLFLPVHFLFKGLWPLAVPGTGWNISTSGPLLLQVPLPGMFFPQAC